MSISNDNLTKLLYLFLILVPALTNTISENNTENADSALLKVFPSHLVVKDINSALPLVNVTVKNVQGLFAWQIKLYFNATILNVTENQVCYPENHVFANKPFVPLKPKVSSDTRGFYVLFGSSLLGKESFSGSGTLCQINFTGITKGTSPLIFSTPLSFKEGTFLLDSSNKLLLVKFVDGKQSSVSLTLEIDSNSFPVGLSAMITGALTPKKVTTLTLYYRRPEHHTWIKMAQVETNSEGSFSYKWKPPAAGNYKIIAQWQGDKEMNPTVSPVITVLVEEPPPSIIPRVALGISLLIIMIVLAYFVRREKKRATEKQEPSPVHDNPP